MNRKPSLKTLKRVLSYLDKSLHIPLSLDDTLYMRWRLHNEIFHREVDVMKDALFEEWNNKYCVKFHDGYYERGQLVKKTGKN